MTVTETPVTDTGAMPAPRRSTAVGPGEVRVFFFFFSPFLFFLFPPAPCFREISARIISLVVTLRDNGCRPHDDFFFFGGVTGECEPFGDLLPPCRSAAGLRYCRERMPQAVSVIPVGKRPPSPGFPLRDKLCSPSHLAALATELDACSSSGEEFSAGTALLWLKKNNIIIIKQEKITNENYLVRRRTVFGVAQKTVRLLRTDPVVKVDSFHSPCGDGVKIEGRWEGVSSGTKE